MKIEKRFCLLVIVFACLGLYGAILSAVSVAINDEPPFECNDSVIDISARGDLKKLKIIQESDDTKVFDSIKFPNVLKDFDTINFIALKIKTLDLSKCLNLKTIKLISCEDIESIQFPAVMENFENIDLMNSGIKALEFPKCPKLTKFSLDYVKNLSSVRFTDIMENLEEINIKESTKIKTIELKRCPKLKKIELELLGDVVLKFPSILEHLEEIKIGYSDIKRITLPTCPQLKKLNLGSNTELEAIEFTGHMPHLTTLDITVCSDIKKISGFKFCPKLQKKDFPSEEFDQLTIIDEPAAADYLTQLKKTLEALKAKLVTLAGNLAGLSAKK